MSSLLTMNDPLDPGQSYAPSQGARKTRLVRWGICGSLIARKHDKWVSWETDEHIWVIEVTPQWSGYGREMLSVRSF